MFKLRCPQRKMPRCEMDKISDEDAPGWSEGPARGASHEKAVTVNMTRHITPKWVCLKMLGIFPMK